MNRLSTAEKRCVLLFVRAPQQGAVKTRLAQAIGADKALALYRCFVEDMHETIATAFPLRLCFHPESQGASMARWLGRDSALCPQRGKTLGDKMRNAFETAFAGGVRRAVLVGSDVPELNNRILARAFDRLATHDMVLGPALDGGYYLVGFNRHSFCPAVFDRIAWGTAQVFGETLEKAAESGCTVHRLPVLSDIDTLADLKCLIKRRHLIAAECRRTADFLAHLGSL